MKDLFLFTIGPVKAFIDNSRKAMDLYAGSRFLSELMDEALKWMKEKNIDILFPIPAEGTAEGSAKDPVNIPNRLVAEFPDCSDQQKLGTAKELTIFIKQRFCGICRELFQAAGIPEAGERLAQIQLEDFLEVYWVFEPFGTQKYSEVYQKLFASIQEIKGIRPFKQSKEPYGRKCLLFPEYNAIFVKKYESDLGMMVYPRQTNKKYMCDITDNAFLQYTVGPKEALSAIALVKRIYGQRMTEFYSLRYMLLGNRIPKLLADIQTNLQTDIQTNTQTNLQAENLAKIQASNQPMWKATRDMLANAVYDLEHGQTFQEEEYTRQVIHQAEALHQKIKKEAVRLNSYYAVIKFDGDNIGDEFRSLETAEKQRELSQRISGFACQVPPLLSRYGGLPVYAGGEDFLGFVPIDHLFECISELYKLFSESLSLSFSAGISIAHLMQPLKEVMEYADNMETEAKKLPGKKAAAIGIMKRSGNNVKLPPYKLSGRGMLPQWTDLSELVQILKSAQCSRSLFFNIARLMRRYWQGGDKPEEKLAEVLLKECILHSAGEDDNLDREKLADQLMLFYRNASQTEEFLQTLDGITFLAREMVG